MAKYNHEFKKGDRVELTSHNHMDSENNLTLGQVGVVRDVTSYETENTLNVYVVWEGYCQVSSHWWVREVDISLENPSLINE